VRQLLRAKHAVMVIALADCHAKLAMGADMFRKRKPTVTETTGRLKTIPQRLDRWEQRAGVGDNCLVNNLSRARSIWAWGKARGMDFRYRKFEKQYLITRMK